MTIERNVVASTDEIAQDRCLFGLIKGAVDVAARTVRGVASSTHVDRHGEVVLPNAIAGDLVRFLATSAPFLAAHMHRSDSGEPMQIGWVKAGAIEGVEFKTLFQFATTKVGEEWWKLASDPAGKGIAFSIGFLPREYVHGQVKDLVREFPQLEGVFKTAGLEGDDRSVVYTKLELLEISGCPVGSNRQSLQERMERFFQGDPKGSGSVPEALRSASPLNDVSKLIEELSKELRDAINQVEERILAHMTEHFDRIECSFPDSAGDGCQHRGAHDDGTTPPREGADEPGDDPIRQAAASLGRALKN